MAVGCVFALVFLWRLRKENRGFADSRPLWFAYWEPRSKVLTLVGNLERHGIKIVVVVASCSCEPGEGKWFVDAKFAHVKRHHRRNVRFDLGGAVCVDSYGRSAQ